MSQELPKLLTLAVLLLLHLPSTLRHHPCVPLVALVDPLQNAKTWTTVESTSLTRPSTFAGRPGGWTHCVPFSLGTFKVSRVPRMLPLG